MAETILIVDDEPSVRQTFTEWLRHDLPGTEILVAADAEAALMLANQRGIDLALLDWNLGAGSHGLQLLEDLHIFQPDLVAILITGYADRATPLDALRLGVRDYFEKNQRLTKDRLVMAVQRQLDKLRPVKRERLVQKQLQAFRSAVEQVLPLVRTAAALRDTVPLAETVRALFAVLGHGTGATAGLLVVRTYQEQTQPPEQWLVLDEQGQALTPPDFHFAQSLAAAVAFQQPEVLRAEIAGLLHQPGLQLLEPETGHQFLMCQALPLGPTTTAVLELFDKRTAEKVLPFEAADQAFLQAFAPFLSLSLKRYFQEQETHAILLEALGQALQTTQQVDQSLRTAPTAEMLREVSQSLEASLVSNIPGPEFRQLAQGLERLAQRHGPPAVQFCAKVLAETERLLDAATGLGEG